MDFWSKLTIFYQANPHLGAKLSSYVAVLSKNMHVYGCRLVLYHSKVNASSWLMFMMPEVGIIDGFIVQPYHFLRRRFPFWRKIE